MNIKEQQRHSMQCEINRINQALQSATLAPRKFRQMNRRRSEILARARALRIDVHAV